MDTLISRTNAGHISEGDGQKLDESNVNGPEVLGRSPQEVGVRDTGQSNPTDTDYVCAGQSNPTDADSECAIAVTLEEPTHQINLDDSCSPKQTLAPDEVEECTNVEAPGAHTESGHVLSNGFKDSNSNIYADGPRGSGDKQILSIQTPAEIDTLPNGLLTDNCIDLDVNCALKPDSVTSSLTKTCFYQCCSECFATLNNLLLRIINIEWKLKGIDSTVDDVHDFVASLSANLHLTVIKLNQTENFSGMERGEGVKYCDCGEIQGSDMEKSGKLLMDCDCHAKSKNESEKEKCSPISERLDSRFVFKGGVMATLEAAGTDVSYHCKYEKLCLCFLIEWLVSSRERFD